MQDRVRVGQVCHAHAYRNECQAQLNKQGPGRRGNFVVICDKQIQREGGHKDHWELIQHHLGVPFQGRVEYHGSAADSNNSPLQESIAMAISQPFCVPDPMQTKEDKWDVADAVFQNSAR